MKSFWIESNFPKARTVRASVSRSRPSERIVAVSAVATNPIRAFICTSGTSRFHALHLFNEGFSWGAHEDWEQFWYGFRPDDTRGQFRPGAQPLASAAVNIREGIFPVGFYDEIVRCSGFAIRGGGTYRRQRENSCSGLWSTTRSISSSACPRARIATMKSGTAAGRDGPQSPAELTSSRSVP